jgi:hypothetical protein
LSISLLSISLDRVRACERVASTNLSQTSPKSRWRAP